jgi:hypothetical protein
MAGLWTFLRENGLKVPKGLWYLTARTYSVIRTQVNYVAITKTFRTHGLDGLLNRTLAKCPGLGGSSYSSKDWPSWKSQEESGG